MQCCISESICGAAFLKAYAEVRNSSSWTTCKPPCSKRLNSHTLERMSLLYWELHYRSTGTRIKRDAGAYSGAVISCFKCWNSIHGNWWNHQYMAPGLHWRPSWRQRHVSQHSCLIDLNGGTFWMGLCCAPQPSLGCLHLFIAGILTLHTNLHMSTFICSCSWSTHGYKICFY